MTYQDILSHLISFDTTTKYDTLEAVKYVQTYFEHHQITPLIIYNKTGTRASIVATIGNPDRVGVILSGHLDVVPANPSTWQTDPFKLTQIDQRFYGRGTSDMKGAIAVSLSKIEEFKASGKTIHFVFTHDEEDESSGIEEVLANAEVQERFKNATGCLVMEPTLSAYVIGQKSVFFGRICIKGISTHSSNPASGVNALAHGIKVHELFYEIYKPFYLEQDACFKVPYPTADITLFNAGLAANTIPDEANLSYSGRFFSTAQETHFIKNLTEKLDTYASCVEGLSITHLPEPSLPAFSIEPNHSFVNFISKFAPLSQEAKISFGTEAGHLSNAGIPTLVMGPGSIKQAHTVDEFIEISELEKYDTLLSLIVKNLAS